MWLEFLGKGGSGDGDCPTLYATEFGYLIVGWKTDQPETVEIPHLLLGYLEPDTFIGTTLIDTGRGTFTLTGKPVTEREVLAKLTMETYETAIEVPKSERTFYGATGDGQPLA